MKNKQISLLLCLVFIFNVVFCNQAEASFLTNWKQKRTEKKIVPTSKMPHTVQEYEEQSKEKTINEIEIPDPQLPKNPKMVNMPSPKFVLSKYNLPAGSVSTDLSSLKTSGQVYGQGVATAQGDKLAYTVGYYNKTSTSVMSEAYIILNKENKSLSEFLRTANVISKINNPILSSGIGKTINGQQNVLTIVDWSKSGQRLLLKETIGERTKGIWQTNLWVYDTEARGAKELFELRNAIKQWWLKNKKIVLDDYMWDIKPVGWMRGSNEAIVTHAFIYTDKEPFFLGEWVINSDGSYPYLASQKSSYIPIQSNGYVLKFGAKY